MTAKESKNTPHAIGKRPDQETALEAISYAQWIAFGPFVFQATVVMRDRGLLDAVADAGDDGIGVSALSETTGVSPYGVKVLLDFGSSIRLVWRKNDRYVLTKTGHFILNDPMTRVNMDFTRDVCYEPLAYLDESIRDEKPQGLHLFGDWKHIYEGLSSLPEQAATSWFNFDHYYSDRVFDEFIPIVFETPVREILDIGGNTGRWALKCFTHVPDVQVTIMDLPGQLAVARKNIEQAGFIERFTEFPADVLDSTQVFYQGADVIWMSQFLDCFSESDILGILKRAVAVMRDDSVLYIVELFWDRQKFDAASFSLNAISLYFTCLANGKSRMYHSDDMLRLIKSAGLVIDRDIDNVGAGHTVLRCKKPYAI